ncbi:protein LNK2-like isoform X1 [Canna indica]|uniref:Protein LNK2-like isoform X1 n=1 Tax=Canna indica TaxID=4628 RepID=A0AAQ3QEW5_9LILI|nr:protein LNK2-like isoform X1 [Canna indica]
MFHPHLPSLPLLCTARNLKSPADQRSNPRQAAFRSSLSVSSPSSSCSLCPFFRGMLDSSEERKQVDGELSSEFNRNEDHLLYLMTAQENTPFTFQHDKMKVKHEDPPAGPSSEPTFASNNHNLVFMENKAISGRDEAIITSNIDLDEFSDFPTFGASYNNGHIDASDQNSVQTELINDLTDSSNLNAVRDCTSEHLNSDAMPHNEDSLLVHRSHTFSINSSVQLDNKPEFSLNEHDDKGSEGLLDCDWDSIEDFNLDSIFRTSDSIDHIFGNEMMEISDGFLSSSDHIVDGVTEFVPIPDTYLCKEKLSDEDLSSLQLDEQHDAKGNAALQTNQVDVDEKLSKSWEKEETTIHRNYDIVSSKLSGSWSYNISKQQSPHHQFHNYACVTPRPYQSPDSSLQRKTSDEESIFCVGSCNDAVSSDSRDHSYHFPSIEEGSNVGAEQRQTEEFSNCHMCDVDPLKHQDYDFGYHHAQRNQKDFFSCCHVYNVDPAVAMTYQGRDAKESKKQQIQFKLEIQQKSKQYSDLKPDCSSSISQASPKNSQNHAMVCTFGSKQTCIDLTIMEKSMLIDSPRISIGNNDNSMAEAIYCQLQAAISKLDNKLRIHIRDSMFRLAKSATERCNITNRSNIDKANVGNETPANGESENRFRTGNASASETVTNHVDRTVAQLLFQRPSKLSSTPIKDELP